MRRLAVSVLLVVACVGAPSAGAAAPKSLGPAPDLVGASRGVALLGADATSVLLMDARSGRRFTVPAPAGAADCKAQGIAWGRVLLQCGSQAYVEEIASGASRALGDPQDTVTFGGIGRYWAIGSYCFTSHCVGILDNLETETGEVVDPYGDEDYDLDQEFLAEPAWCATRRDGDRGARRTVARPTPKGFAFLTCGRARRTAACRACRIADFDGTRLLAIRAGRLWELRLRTRRIDRRRWRIPGLDRAFLAGTTAMAAREVDGGVRLYSVALT